MKQYWVEGLYVGKKAEKRVNTRQGDVEPFAQLFWAASPQEAIAMATEALEGGKWVEGPQVGITSEEQRMRQIGAPELPGFGPE